MKETRYANSTVGNRHLHDEGYLEAVEELLDNAQVLRESTGPGLVMRVVTYAQPGTGTQVWALDYRAADDWQIAEYADLAGAADDYEGQVETFVIPYSDDRNSPLATTDVEGVPVRSADSDDD